MLNNDQEAVEMVVVLFGKLEVGLDIFYEMVVASKLGVTGIEILMDYYCKWLTIAKEFYISIRAIGSNVKFDLKDFIVKCKTISPKFSIQLFLEKLASWENTDTLESELIKHMLEVNVLFFMPYFFSKKFIRLLLKESGLEKISKKKFKSITTTLCGEFEMHVQVCRLWALTLRKCGVDMFVRTIYSGYSSPLDDIAQSQLQIIAAIKMFVFRIRSLAQDARFHLGQFITNAKLIYTDFDVRMFIRRLNVCINIDIDSSVHVFKQCGIFDIDKTGCESLFTILFGNAAHANQILQWWIQLVRVVGVDMFLMHVENYCEHPQLVKVEGEEEVSAVVTVFLTQVRYHGSKSKFDILGFLEGCRLANTNPEFSLRDLVNILVRLRKHLEQGASGGKGMIVNWVLEECGLPQEMGERRTEILSAVASDTTKAAELFFIWSSYIEMCGENVFLQELEKVLMNPDLLHDSPEPEI